MTKNLIESLQEAAGFEPLQKIDPNTQDADKSKSTQANRLGQAVIPAVLVGFYEFSRIEEDAQSILHLDDKTDWMKLLFKENEDSVVKRVAQYAGISIQDASKELRITAQLAAEKIKEHLQEDKHENVKEYMTSQRNIILHYLPASLDIGKMLHDDTLDDKTNKMEGPVSNWMHKIEKIFAGTDNPGEKK